MKPGSTAAWARRASIALLLAFIAAAVGASATQGAWIDEGYSFATTAGSLSRSASLALNVEAQPPLYFILLDLWRGLDGSLFFARLLSAALATVAIWSLASGIRAAHPRTTPWLEPVTLAFIAAHPFVFLASAEARGYALQLALGSLLTMTLLRALANGRATRRHVAAFLVFGVLGAYTHYFVGLTAAVLVIVARVFGLLSTRALLVIAGAAGVACLPLLPFLHAHLQVVTTSTDAGILPGAQSVLEVIGSNIVPTVTWRAPLQIGLLVLVAAVIAVGLFRARPAAWTRVSRPARALLLALGLAAVVLYPLAVVGGASAVRERYLASLFPVSWGALILLLDGAVGAPLACLTVGGLALLSAGRCAKIVTTDSRSGGWKTMSAFIRNADARVVYAFPSEEALAGRLMLGGDYVVRGLPRDYDGTRKLLESDFALEPLDALAHRIEGVAGTRPFWVTLSREPVVPVGTPDNLTHLERFVSSCTNVLAAHELRDSTLRLCTLRPSCRH